MNMGDEWLVYALRLAADGPVLYVGSSCSPKRRLKEHRRRFGRTVLMERIISGNGPAREEEEARWTAYYHSLGECSANISEGRRAAQSTRDKIRRLVIGRHPSVETRAKMSAASKGKLRNWSAEGKKRVQSSQFKPGHYKFSELPQEMQDFHIATRRKQWEGIDSATRTKMAHDRNIEAWAKRSAKQRKAVGRNIVAGKLRNRSAEEIAELARVNGRKAAEQWALLTPEQKAARKAKISVGVRAAKQRAAAAGA